MGRYLIKQQYNTKPYRFSKDREIRPGFPKRKELEPNKEPHLKIVKRWFVSFNNDPPEDPYRQETEEDRAIRRLWLTVLIREFWNLREILKRPHTPKKFLQLYEMARWIQTRDFVMVCDLSDIDYRVIFRKIQKVFINYEIERRYMK